MGNSRIDLLAANRPRTRACNRRRRRPSCNTARFIPVDPRAEAPPPRDRDRVATETVAIPRSAAGPDPSRPRPVGSRRRAGHPERGVPHPLGRAQRPLPHRRVSSSSTIRSSADQTLNYNWLDLAADHRAGRSPSTPLSPGRPGAEAARRSSRPRRGRATRAERTAARCEGRQGDGSSSDRSSVPESVEMLPDTIRPARSGTPASRLTYERLVGDRMRRDGAERARPLEAEAKVEAWNALDHHGSSPSSGAAERVPDQPRSDTVLLAVGPHRHSRARLSRSSRSTISEDHVSNHPGGVLGDSTPAPE